VGLRRSHEIRAEPAPHYDRRKAAGDSHNAALRNLANKLLGRLWWCLTNKPAWDDNAAWPTTPGPTIDRHTLTSTRVRRLSPRR